MPFHANKGFWLVTAVVGALAVTVIWLVNTNEPFRLTVLFDEVGGLKKDDLVVWRTFTVGKVDQIEPLVENKIGVRIRLKDEYAPRITRGTEFLLKRTALFGLVGDNGIELVTPDAPGAPFRNGETVLGRTPPPGSDLTESARWTTEYWRRLKDETSQAIEEFRSSPRGEEITAIFSELQALAAQGARQAGGSLERFWKDHEKDVDQLLQKLESIRDGLRREGKGRDAERVDRRIDEFRRTQR